MHHPKTAQTSSTPLLVALLLAGLLLAPVPVAAQPADAGSGPADFGSTLIDLVQSRALAVWDSLSDLVVPSSQDDTPAGDGTTLRWQSASDDGTNDQGSGLDPLGAK